MTTSDPQIFIVSGPSGSGKSTVVDYLLKDVPGTLFSVSHTTRPPRSGEKEGREYFFISRDEFGERIKRDEFLEYNYHFGNWYGTHRTNLDRAAREGKDLLLDIDIEGGRQVKEKMPEAVSILFIPPSRQELENRLRARGQDTEEVIAQRLERAREEISSYNGYDYLVVNDQLDRACRQVRAIFLAERKRSGRAVVDAGDAEDVEAPAEAARRENNAAQVSVILESFNTTESYKSSNDRSETE